MLAQKGPFPVLLDMFAIILLHPYWTKSIDLLPVSWTFPGTDGPHIDDAM